ncbi:MAG: response regulator [Gammaproteobacteria bacterium]|nr:response regulator [Gammaproteobacteria bacterium]
MTKQKILIIEDDKDQLKGLLARLRMSGYDVVTATDAITAISATRKADPDLILLDIGLPAGDGFLVLQRLEDMGLNTMPVIILSGRDPWQNEEKALAAGAVAFLQKPVDNNVLLTTISKELGPIKKSA